MKTDNRIFWACAIFLAFFAMNSLTSLRADDSKFFISPDFSNIMVKNLLRIGDYKSSEGQLKALKEWDNELSNILNKKDLSKEEMKAYFLIVLIADARGKVHTNEVISETIVQRYEDNTEVFLATLHELPYLIPIVGDAMNSHFMSFFKKEKRKSTFIKKNESIILATLGNRKGNDFIKFIKDGKVNFYY